MLFAHMLMRVWLFCMAVVRVAASVLGTLSYLNWNKALMQLLVLLMLAAQGFTWPSQISAYDGSCTYKKDSGEDNWVLLLAVDVLCAWLTPRAAHCLPCETRHSCGSVCLHWGGSCRSHYDQPSSSQDSRYSYTISSCGVDKPTV